MTLTEFREYINRPENKDRRFELLYGIAIEMSSSSKLNMLIANLIAFFITAHVRQHKLGYVSSADGGYKLNEDTILIPDVGFISSERVGDLTGVEFEVAPDLAVEVVSPSESTPRVLDKVRILRRERNLCGRYIRRSKWCMCTRRAQMTLEFKLQS